MAMRGPASGLQIDKDPHTRLKDLELDQVLVLLSKIWARSRKHREEIADLTRPAFEASELRDNQQRGCDAHNATRIQPGSAQRIVRPGEGRQRNLRSS